MAIVTRNLQFDGVKSGLSYEYLVKFLKSKPKGALYGGNVCNLMRIDFTILQKEMVTCKFNRYWQLFSDFLYWCRKALYIVALNLTTTT